LALNTEAARGFRIAHADDGKSGRGATSPVLRARFDGIGSCKAQKHLLGDSDAVGWRRFVRCTRWRRDM